jgi:hypothetical protein
VSKDPKALKEKGQYVTIEHLQEARAFVLRLLIRLKQKHERNGPLGWYDNDFGCGSGFFFCFCMRGVLT